MAYNPKTWTTGETITAAELNAIEQAASAAAAAADTANTGLGGKVSSSTYTAGLATKAPQLVPTATKTAPYTAAVGDLAVLNVAGGATALTLPTAPADKSAVGFLAVGATATTPLTVNRGGTDTLGPSGATAISIALANEATIYQYDAANTRWLAVANVKPQSALDAAYTPTRSHASTNPLSSLSQNAGGRTTCGVDAALGKVWAFNSGGLYQVDSLTATNWAAVTLPANVTPGGAEAKVVTYTPTSGANAGTKLMFVLSWNTATSRYEIYSAPPTARTVAPTWSSLLLQLSANATVIPTAFRACSTGLFVGEYSSTTDITGGPSVWRTTDGSTWTKVLGPLGSTTRHIHGIYEDPYNLGTIYISVGDAFNPYAPPYFLYKSTDGGATFAGVPTLTSGIWQCVSMGFTADGIWLCSDQTSGAGPVYLDRATMTPRWATTKSRHDRMAVPGGVGGRFVSDVVMTASSTTITSATANFTAQDKGRIVGGNNAIPIGTFITSVTNATTVVLSTALSNTQSGQPMVITGDTFFANAYMGGVDPATGWLYVVANDGSVSGTTGGIFVMPGRDAPFTLLYPIFSANLGHYEAYMAGGYLWIDRYGPMPLLTP